MKNQNTSTGTASGKPQESSVQEVSIAEFLRLIERHLAREVGLSQVMLKKLNSIDVSVSILAAQKARELSPEESADAPDK
jgi:hypothetical protein